MSSDGASQVSEKHLDVYQVAEVPVEGEEASGLPTTFTIGLPAGAHERAVLLHEVAACGYTSATFRFDEGNVTLVGRVDPDSPHFNPAGKLKNPALTLDVPHRQLVLPGLHDDALASVLACFKAADTHDLQPMYFLDGDGVFSEWACALYVVPYPPFNESKIESVSTHVFGLPVVLSDQLDQSRGVTLVCGVYGSLDARLVTASIMARY